MVVQKDPETGKPMLLMGDESEVSKAIARIASDSAVAKLCGAVVRVAMNDYEMAYESLRWMTIKQYRGRSMRRARKDYDEVSSWMGSTSFISTAGLNPDRLMDGIEDGVRIKQNNIY